MQSSEWRDSFPSASRAATVAAESAPCVSARLGDLSDFLPYQTPTVVYICEVVPEMLLNVEEKKKKKVSKHINACTMFLDDNIYDGPFCCGYIPGYVGPRKLGLNVSSFYSDAVCLPLPSISSPRVFPSIDLQRFLSALLFVPDSHAGFSARRAGELTWF